MGLKDTTTRLLAPNPDNMLWLSASVQMVGALARVSNVYSLFFVLMAIYIVVAMIILFYTGRYVFSVYSRRLREKGPHVRLFIAGLIAAVICFAIGFSMVFSGDYELIEQGRILVYYTFGGFCLFVAACDWWADRALVKALPSLKGVSAEEVIKMHKIVQTSKKG
jgi:hypothetical protein